MSQAFIVVGLSFGDEGKGALTDALTRRTGAHTVVRFSGGAQAAHRVVTADGREHIFSQFGSGTLAGADTYLSEFMVIEPMALLNEAKHLEEIGVPKPLSHLTIHGDALVVTPQHVALNRLRELARGEGRFGTTGLGITCAVEGARDYGRLTAIRFGDLSDRIWSTRKIERIQKNYQHEFMRLEQQIGQNDTINHLHRLFFDTNATDTFLETGETLSTSGVTQVRGSADTLLNRDGTIIFEGAQGALLDQYAGYNPFTTRSNTGLENAELLLERAGYNGTVISIGVTRAYSTRHGPGPFPTEDAQMTRELPDSHNIHGEWQGAFRVGHLDLVGLRHALNTVSPVDALAITCMDRIQELQKVCRTYAKYGNGGRSITRLPLHTAFGDRKTKLTKLVEMCYPNYANVPKSELTEYISKDLSTPIIGTSWGPTAEDWHWEKDALCSI